LKKPVTLSSTTNPIKVPSTAKPKLEEMDYICTLRFLLAEQTFDTNEPSVVRIKTRTHVKFQATEMIPWHFRRLILRRTEKDDPEPVFIEWSEEQAVQSPVPPTSPGFSANHFQSQTQPMSRPSNNWLGGSGPPNIATNTAFEMQQHSR
jgi:hypothetical protein